MDYARKISVNCNFPTRPAQASIPSQFPPVLGSRCTDICQGSAASRATQRSEIIRLKAIRKSQISFIAVIVVAANDTIDRGSCRKSFLQKNRVSLDLLSYAPVHPLDGTDLSDLFVSYRKPCFLDRWTWLNGFNRDAFLLLIVCACTDARQSHRLVERKLVLLKILLVLHCGTLRIVKSPVPTVGEVNQSSSNPSSTRPHRVAKDLLFSKKGLLVCPL